MEDVSYRAVYNLEILNELTKFALEHPYLRFWQVMSILGYELKDDKFYEESKVTLKEIKKKIKEKSNNHD